MEDEKAQPEDLIELANNHRITTGKSVSTIKTVNGAVEYFIKAFGRLSNEVIPALRAAIRQQIQIDALTNPKYVPMEYYADFNGSGDSGQIDAVSGNGAVDFLLEYMVETHVTFDWYNNEGGGGTITWDITTDKMTIDGYQNVFHTETVMDDEEV